MADNDAAEIRDFRKRIPKPEAERPALMNTGWTFLIGLILLINPGAGALAVVWLIGVYALLFGGLLTFLGLKFRKLQNLP
jgi:hypothetical protein